MGSPDATVCCDNRSDSICPKPGANPQLCNFTIRKTPSCFTIDVILRLQLFHQLFAAHRPFYLTERFWTLICQSKGPYSSVLLSSLCVPWPTGAFWHCFASSAAVSWHQFLASFTVFPHSGCWHIFSWHWFSYAVMFGVISILSRKLVTLMKSSKQ